MSKCRALLVSAPASGQGKTTVTAALARRARQDGLRVRVFKTGPDFLDPMVLEQASGAPVYQLDLWMVGEADSACLLEDAAREADLVLVEGVMGLYDGNPSSADLAQRFGLPVLAVIDGSGMAQTFGAVAFGLSHFGQHMQLHGVVANRVGSPGHAKMLANSLPPSLAWLGALPRDAAFTLPERHLGLVQSAELADLDTRLDAAAQALGAAVPFENIPQREFPAAHLEPIEPLLAGLRIAVARDAAHGFLYRANLDTLHALGARLLFFSPLGESGLPECDALYLPGGYPELHAAQLASNHGLRTALHAHHAAGRPILAECGGMMSLLEQLVDREGYSHRLFGLLPGTTTMQPKLAALGLQAVDLPQGELRGHSFHYSRCETTLDPTWRARNPNGGATAEPVYRHRALTASYVHFYFASNPAAAAALFLP